jgi:hypothetical protein
MKYIPLCAEPVVRTYHFNMEWKANIRFRNAWYEAAQKTGNPESPSWVLSVPPGK